MNTALVVICCCAAGALFILIAPCILTTQFTFLRNNRSGILLLHWIHPWVALVKYTIGSGTTEFRLFGWTRTISEKQETGESRGAPPVPQAPGKKTGTAAAMSTGNKSARSSAIPQSSATPRSSDTAAGPSAPPMPDVERPEEPPLRKRLTWARAKKTLAILRRGRAMSKIFRWCRRLFVMSLRIVRFDHLRFHAAAGAPDPADTGKLFGYFSAFRSAIFSDRRNMDIRLEPRFAETVLEFEGSVGLKTSIAGIVTPAVVALLTFPYITVFFAWRRLKKV